jgi:hypothetical protein
MSQICATVLPLWRIELIAVLGMREVKPMIFPAWFEILVEVALVATLLIAFGSAAAVALRRWRLGRRFSAPTPFPNTLAQRRAAR